MAGLHHVEIWVADFAAARSSWNWLLTSLGFTSAQDWPEGRSWSAGGTYVTVTTPPHVRGTVHDRRLPGVNHLAFDGGTPADVDAMMHEASAHGWRPLYHDRYPHAGGPDHYAGWLENGDGFKAEVVATSA